MLDASNSRRYRSRGGATKLAVLCGFGADYILSWGAQHFGGPHMRVLDAQGAYGVHLGVFFRTHRAVPNHPYCYVKTAEVRAACALQAFTLVTWVHGSVEMVAEVPPGAYVVQNPDGECYAMSAEQFAQRYEAAG